MHGSRPRPCLRTSRPASNTDLVGGCVLLSRTDRKCVTVRHRHGDALIEESLETLEQEIGSCAVRVRHNTLAMAAQVVGLEKMLGSVCALVFCNTTD
jgi:two-component system response regulator AlgR